MFRDILVFCTGQEEIEHMVSSTRETCFQLPLGPIFFINFCKIISFIYNLILEQRNLLPLPLYAALLFDIQYKIFKNFPVN